MAHLPLSLAVAVALLAPCVPARAGALEGDVRVSGAALLDSNPLREFRDDTGARPLTHGGLSLLGSAAGRHAAGRLQVLGRYDAGVRVYPALGEADTLVQAAALEGSLALGRFVAVGLGGHAKDRRGGERSYADLAASAFLEYVPEARVDVRVHAGAHRFLYRPLFASSFGAPEVGLFGRWRLGRRHALSVHAAYEPRHFRAPARAASGQPLGERREDSALTAGLGWGYRGPFSLSVGYAYQEVVSNSFGETVLRHRLSAAAGVRLPWRLTLLAQGTLALHRYPDGVFLTPEASLVEDDEGQNVLSVRLVRPLDAHLDLELTYGVHGTRLPANGLRYLRHTGALGLTWRLGGRGR